MKYTYKLPIIIHTEYLALSWGKKLIDCFKKYVSSRDIQLIVITNADSIDWSTGGYNTVIVIGVDTLWLTYTVDILRSKNLRIIMMAGEYDDDSRFISVVRYDQRSIIYDSLKLLKSHYRLKTAFFGTQINDSSDISKESYFANYFCMDDIYSISDTLENCFGKFYDNIDRYDSVICSNDYIAVVFLSYCRRYGIAVPDDLFVVGNGNIRLSYYISPSLTTVIYNTRDLVEVAVDVFRKITSLSSIDSVSVNLHATINERESTGNRSDIGKAKEPEEIVSAYPDVDHYANLSTEIRQVQLLEQILSGPSVELEIIRGLMVNNTYESISESLMMSADAVKYHIKKIYNQLNVHSKEELSTLMNKYSVDI